MAATPDVTTEEVMPEVFTAEVSGEMMLKASLIAAAATTSSNSGAPEPVSLDEAKAHLRVVGDDEDPYISTLIAVAREMAEGRLNRTIRQRTRTEVFASWNDTLVLRKPPVILVTDVSYVDGNGEDQTLSADQYFAGVYTEPAVVELIPDFQAPLLHYRRRSISVTYLAGYPEGEVPRAICQWILLAVGALYQNRESLVTGISVAELPENFMALLLQPYRVYE